MTPTVSDLRKRSSIYCSDHDDHVQQQWRAVHKVAAFVCQVSGCNQQEIERKIETMIERDVFRFIRFGDGIFIQPNDERTLN